MLFGRTTPYSSAQQLQTFAVEALLQAIELKIPARTLRPTGGLTNSKDSCSKYRFGGYKSARTNPLKSTTHPAARLTKGCMLTKIAWRDQGPSLPAAVAAFKTGHERAFAVRRNRSGAQQLQQYLCRGRTNSSYRAAGISAFLENIRQPGTFHREDMCTTAFGKLPGNPSFQLVDFSAR